jgi:hypothetical protein
MLLVTGHAQVWELVALQGFGGASVAFYNPAFYGLVRELVPPEGMQKANGYLAIARYAAFPLGAATGGSIVATVGAGTALLFDGGTYAVSALLLSFVRVESLARAGSSIVHELREGWQAFTESAWLWRMTLWISLYFMITYAPFFVLGPYIAEHSMPAAALAGFGFACGSVVFDTAMQPSIPPDKLARVGAYSWMSAMVFLPAGYTLAGPIASAVGMRAYLLFGAAWLVASTLVVYRQPAVRGFSYEEQAPEQDPLPAPS